MGRDDHDNNWGARSGTSHFMELGHLGIILHDEVNGGDQCGSRLSAA
jgi:hypothetical protein